MNYQTLIVEKKKGYVVVRLNRPHEMNAISGEMRQELYSVFVELEADQEARAIVLTGGEYVFSAGMDIKEMNSLPDEESDEFLKSMMKYLKKIYSCKKPVIAAVGGIALGGGFNLVTVCDLVVASESAIFCHPELKFGFNPFFYPLSQIVGITKAKEIVMLGEPIGAHEAVKLGLVNKVESPEKFMEVAETMAETLSKRSPKALEELKNLCSIVPRMDKMAAMDIESSICALLFARDERKEQMKEVLSKDKSHKR
ncbi:MAG TPA: enoyl-CoA hydratase/isomerase family protein [Smithella sp.]|nr:enoyl-CoA hydratase/isomerase family protein [Smithella sp.]MDM7986123.1 enoyl-CoA hydratase/isomerase family protein [Smithella sp.]HNY48981.1 enoyl-CoA hydratase/isomerase family protein [Smithella sp.]HOG89065.1 enoyl-CoA hydratase/isomerase family protein [Smithella sp.]HOU50977.1 enoyl-CoA hydratase/isomerase family protein [Smithella sp.]